MARPVSIALLLATICALITYTTADNFYDFIPVYEGTLMIDAPLLTWNSSCFSKISLTIINISETGAALSITTSYHSSIFCIDYYVFATREQFRFELALKEGEHLISFSDWTLEEYADVVQNGIQVFKIQDRIFGTLRDIWETYQLFRATKSSPADNIKFLEDRMNLTIKPRTTGVVNLPQETFQTGDQLAIFLPVGNDVLIMWGSGSRTTHHAVFLWDNATLYVCESCSSTCLGNVTGVQRTPWSEWMPRAVARGMSVAFLPLDPKLRAVFNETAAVEYFKSVEGLPYGFHNFFFGWIDTVDENYPPPLSYELLAVLLPMLDKIDHNNSSKIFGEPLAQRLGLPLNSSMLSIYRFLEATNVSLGAAISLPEQDRWVYTDGPSIVCDVLWLELVKAAGILVNLGVSISATEFTPGDAYQLQVFDAYYSLPQQCLADGLPYCQLFGPYLLELPGWNTIAPYPHMNERCPTVPPNYLRTPGC